MQKLITKYGLAAHLALTAVAPLFLSPTAVLWLSALALLWLVMEPSRIGAERLKDARKRVSRAVVADPLFWVCLALVAVAFVRMLNTGIGLSYDAEAGKWFLSEATFPLLPGSVDGTGYPMVAAAFCALVVVQGCRHGLGRSARGAFALVASALSGLGAFVWAYLFHEGLPAAIKASTCLLTELSFQGCVYGVYLTFALVALAMAFERHWFKAMPLTVVGTAGNLLGLFIFSPPAVAAAFAAAALIVFAYAFVYLRLQVGRTSEFKFLVFVGLGICIAVVAAHGFLSASMVNERVAPFTTGAFVPDGFLESRAALSGVSARIWKESPWLGSGFATFPLDLQYNATPAEWTVVSPLQKSVPNGYWLLLAERGVVGAFFLAVPVMLLVISYVMRMVKGVMVALPMPLSWVGLILFIVAGLEMLVDVSFLSPAAIVALASAMSLSANAFPKESQHNV